MSPYEAGHEWQEIPLGTGGRQHVARRDSHPVEDDRNLVHQRDIEIALRVLDHLCRFGYLDAGRLVKPCIDDAPVNVFEPSQGFFILGGDDLGDGFQAMDFVARIDAFGTVAKLEIAPALQAGDFFQDRGTDIVRDTRIDRRFEYDDRSLGEMRCDKLAGRTNGRQIRAVLAVDRRGNGDDEESRVRQASRITGDRQRRRGKLFVRNLAGPVGSTLQRGDTPFRYVETCYAVKFARQGNGHR